MMEPRRTSNMRVEKKGRFTITEIIPGSPNSACLSSPTFHDDDVSVSDAAFEDASDDMDDGALQSRQAAVVTSSDGEPLLAVGLAQDKPVESGRPESPSEAVAVAVAAPVAPAIAVEAAASASSEAPVAAATAVSVAATAAAATEPVSQESSPEKSPEQSASASASAPRTPTMRPSSRRVKRKGRFTIIELASDSPTSRKNADDLYDHRFMTTTSIAPNAEAPAQQPVPANLTRYTRSYGDPRRTKPKPKPKPKLQRAVRSMTRYRQPGTTRKSRRRSESPMRELLEPMDMVDPSGNQQQQQEAAAAVAAVAAAVYAGSEDLYSDASVAASPVGIAPSSSPTCASAAMTDTGSVSVPSHSSTTTSTTTSTPMTPLQQLVQVPEGGALPPHGARLPQTAITISATQFLQQQQTIASLIHQQHDLKQIIGVLQEQQQQLMTIPMQINELKRGCAGADSGAHVNNNAEAKDEETRELYVQVETLMRANDSLQSLLNSAEQDARHRSLEVECLSEENDELRHRCALLESRYLDERKQGFILEDDLQRFRKLALVQQEQQQQAKPQPQQTDDKAVPLE